MNRDRLEEFRQKLRGGQRVRVVNGRVELAAAASEPPQAAQPTASVPARNRPASVTAGVQVKPHEWGTAGPEGDPVYSSDEGQARALQEQALLAREYPGFEMDVDDDGTLFVQGFIGPNPHLRGAYHVLVLIPPGYGRGVMPRAYVLEPQLRAGAPHIYNDGGLCLDHSGAFTRKSTLVTFLAWVSVWLVLYEGWVDGGTTW